MKRTLLLFLFSFPLVQVCIGKNSSSNLPNRATFDWRAAVESGLPGTLLLKVTDEDGSPIKGAKCEGWFQPYGKEGKMDIAHTDRHGCATLTGKVNWHPVVIRIFADGFYSDLGRERHLMPSSRQGIDKYEHELRKAVEQGHWMVSQKPMEIKLKKKGNSLPEVTMFDPHRKIPAGQNVVTWFDFETGETSSGEPPADSSGFLKITTSFNETHDKRWYTNLLERGYSIRVEPGSDKGGFAFCGVDEWSEYKYPKTAPVSGYTNMLEWTSKMRVFPEKSVLVYRENRGNGRKKFYLVLRMEFGRHADAHGLFEISYYDIPETDGNSIEVAPVQRHKYFQDRRKCKNMKFDGEIPFGTNAWFDCVAGDFLPPFGCGTESNLCFRIDGNGNLESHTSLHGETKIESITNRLYLATSGKGISVIDTTPVPSHEKISLLKMPSVLEASDFVCESLNNRNTIFFKDGSNEALAIDSASSSGDHHAVLLFDLRLSYRFLGHGLVKCILTLSYKFNPIPGDTILE